MDDEDKTLPVDPALNEDKNENDVLLRERGLRPEELSPEERKDLVDDIRGDSIDNDEDADKLSDVTTDEESDGND